MPRPRIRRPAALLALIGAACAAAAEPRPAAPVLDAFFPPVVTTGAATAVIAAGKFAAWPPDSWTDAPGINLLPEKETGKFRVEIAADVSPGPHLVRLFNASGASAPRFLLVATTPPLAEVEPNDEPARAQPVTSLPAVITGRLAKVGDVDGYALELAAGQTFTAALDAQVIASPVDAVLRLLDPRGVEVAFNHDNGRNPDPLLNYTALAAGRHVLQVFGFAHPATADVRLHGSDAAVYILKVTPGQPPPASLPAAEGVMVPPDGAPKTPPRAPFTSQGVIARAGAEVVHAFQAAKGEKLALWVTSAAPALPFDPWLALRDSSGKELHRNDDGPSGGSDPFLEWKAPADGTYTAVVGNLLHHGAPDHRYQLVVRAARPTLEAFVIEPGVALDPGGSAELKITLRRLEGFRGKLTASCVGLPGCVSAVPVTADEKQKEITLVVKAPSDAEPFNGPVDVRIREEEGGREWTVAHELVSTTLNNGVPQGFRDLLIRSSPVIWLTVRPLAEPGETPAKTKPKKPGK
jgi:hypothetical protein